VGEAVIVEERVIGGRGRLSAESMLYSNGAAADAVGRTLQRVVVGEAERNGIPIRAEDVWLFGWWDQDGSYIVDARWAPDPEEGVLLTGGPLDGELLRTRREPGDLGRPARRLRTMGAPEFPVFDVSGEWPIPERIYDYERVGIDVADHRWVYRYRGES
jgi:hypothetical protein